MKRITFIGTTAILMLFHLPAQSQTGYDDIYFKPSQAKIVQQQQNIQNNNQHPNYKNGAKEIIFKDQNNHEPETAPNDSAQLLVQANDSTERMAADSTRQQGYYLNGFNGTQSDMEYAQRIRRFHDPRYMVFEGDPWYNDIYFLDNFDWNVYVDGAYAYVTPTWSNPLWWNYYTSPFGGWYGGYWNSPWNWYGGMYGGWGNPYYGYAGYYGWGGYGYGGYGWGYPYNYGWGYGYPYWGNTWATYRDPNHDEANRRAYSGNSTRLGGTSRTAGSAVIAGSNTASFRNPYTIVAGGTTTSAYRTATSPVYTASGALRTVRLNPTESSATNTRYSYTTARPVRTGTYFDGSTNRINRSVYTIPRTSQQRYTINPSTSYRSEPNNTVQRRVYSEPARQSYNDNSFRNTPTNNSFESRSSYGGGGSSYSGGGGGGGSSRSDGGRR